MANTLRMDKLVLNKPASGIGFLTAFATDINLNVPVTLTGEYDATDPDEPYTTLNQLADDNSYTWDNMSPPA